MVLETHTSLKSTEKSEAEELHVNSVFQEDLFGNSFKDELEQLRVKSEEAIWVIEISDSWA